MVRASRARFEMWYIRAIQRQCVVPNVDPLYLHVTLIPSDKELRWKVCSEVLVVFKSDDKPLIRSIPSQKTHQDAVYVFGFMLAHQWRLAF